MTWGAVLLVTAVVWAVSMLRSVRLRALVYSLPLPMTLALVATGHRVDGAQLLGVVGLNLFFALVALTYRRLRWPILLADLAGIAGYLALSAGVLAVPLPFEAALAGTVALWTLAMVLLRRRARARGPAGRQEVREPAREPAGREAVREPAREPAERKAEQVPAGREPAGRGRDGLAAPAKLVVIFAGALLTGLLGELLRGMVVTFPYSGVLVAVEARRELADFTRHFARNSLGLVGFLTGYHYLQDTSPALALAGGWAAFALLAAALHLPRRRPARSAGAGPPVPPPTRAARPAAVGLPVPPPTRPDGGQGPAPRPRTGPERPAAT
ncbi:hypothetical protein ACIBPB_26820 [Micromonospora sp. NPDC049836]|uniref:hypothetical protein n=1 Tax=Micromonospora sp. NPDC049836 TaxID=3364274 RepID=UPI003789AA5A